VNNSTFYHDDPNILDEDSFDIDPVTGLRRYVFNYDLDTRQGDQTAIPNANPIRTRITFGDCGHWEIIMLHSVQPM
jgi:hypothetical protein